MQPLTPVYTAHLLLPLHRELISLLRGFSAVQWERETVVPGWSVKDVAGHLLDGMLRRLSMDRDGHRSTGIAPRSTDYAGITAFVDELNRSGVAYAERLSPRVLVETLALIGPAVAEHMSSRDPGALAAYAVLWAGEAESRHWMDTGREYTEHWHHQAQIRDATGAEPLIAPEWVEPLMDLSVRALPRAYGETDAPDGSAVVLRVDGVGDWSVLRQGGRWEVLRGAAPAPRAVVSTDAGTAWKLFYNALKAGMDGEQVRVHGDAALARPMLAARSVMV